MKTNPTFAIINYGDSTHAFIDGRQIGEGVTALTYSHNVSNGKKLLYPHLSLEIDLCDFTWEGMTFADFISRVCRDTEDEADAPTSEQAATVTTVKVNTSKRTIVFVDEDNQPIGEFRFCPVDVGLISRYSETIKRFPMLNGTIQPDDLERAAKEIREIMNFLFNSDSGDVFKKVNPFSPVEADGKSEMFFEAVLDAAREAIEQGFQKSLKNIKRKSGKDNGDLLTRMLDVAAAILARLTTDD